MTFIYKDREPNQILFQTVQIS